MVTTQQRSWDCMTWWPGCQCPWYGGIRAVIKLAGIISVNCREPPGVIRDNDQWLQPWCNDWQTQVHCPAQITMREEQYFLNLSWLINCCCGMLWCFVLAVAVKLEIQILIKLELLARGHSGSFLRPPLDDSSKTAIAREDTNTYLPLWCYL